MIGWRGTILGMLGGLGLCALLALAAFGWGHLPASAAGPTGAQASATPGAPSDEQLLDAVLARFAARLGTDEATLNAAFVGAVHDTIDELVRDGHLPADKAAEIKAGVAAKGLRGMLAGQQPDEGKPGTGQKDQADTALVAAWNAAATTLGLDGRQMKEHLGSGKSLSEIATARGVDPAKLREAMLAAARAALDQAVRDGVLTQADADACYADITRWTDDLINQGAGKR